MAHSTNIISSVKLPDGVTYEIHDAQAIHSVEDLGLSAALVFKGTKSTDAEILAITSAKKGDVWLATGTNTEYVCIKTITAADSTAWEKLGNVHDAASSTHKHTVAVSGSNAASSVTGTVTVPTVSKTQKYMTAGASGVAVGANGTAKAITALGTATTAAAITELNTTTVKNPSVTAVSIPNVTGNTNVSIPNVTANTDVTASYVTCTVTDGVLSITTADRVASKTTLGTALSASKVTLGTALSASKVTTSDVTVATGSKSTADAITGFGTHSTSNCLTGVKVTAQPIVTLTENATEVEGSVPVVSAVSIGSTSASLTNGTAAAQKWTQGTVTVSTPQ